MFFEQQYVENIFDNDEEIIDHLDFMRKFVKSTQRDKTKTGGNEATSLSTYHWFFSPY